MSNTFSNLRIFTNIKWVAWIFTFDAMSVSVLWFPSFSHQ